MPDVEALAVSEITSAIALSDFIRAEIKAGDKFPSFDGEILIEPKGTGNKEELKIVRVQVKGRMAKSADELDKDKVTFPVDVTDLVNYARNGGVMFFCVLVHGTRRRAYYNSLLPVKLRALLKSAHGQSTKTIELAPVPEDTQEFEELLINHERDSVTQFSFWNAELPDADLTNIPPGICYSARYTSLAPNEYEAARRMFGKDMYLYMEKGDFPIPIPTNTTVQISSMGKRISKPISVAGNTFFEECKSEITEHGVDITIGNLTISYPPEGKRGKVKLNLRLTGTFRVRLHSLRFAKALVINGGFCIGNTNISLANETEAESFLSGEIGQVCSFYEDIASVLEAFQDEGDFDMGPIVEDDLKAIRMLKQGLVEGRRIPLNEIEYDRAVCGIHFLGRHYLLFRETGEDGLSSIRDYVNYETDMAMSAEKDSSMLRVAKYAFARPDEYLNVANLTPNMLVEACKRAGHNDANREVSNDIGLALLSRYDDMGNTADLEAAKEVFEWLAEGAEGDKSLIYEVNLLQTECRGGNLKQEGIERARGIIEEDASRAPSKRELTAACYAILGDEKHAKSAFKKLNKRLRDKMLGYPIGNLINGSARYEAGK